MMQIQGAASGRRGHPTKNKKWVAGQDSARNGRAPDGERWDRGGARRRGGGRGRVHGSHHDTHLAVPSDAFHGDTSATEDDGASVTSAMEDEAEQSLVEPEPEDKEKFYQEVRISLVNCFLLGVHGQKCACIA